MEELRAADVEFMHPFLPLYHDKRLAERLAEVFRQEGLKHKELEAAEIGYTVADTQPPRRQNEVVAEKIAVEYVVRQSLLSDNKVALVTVKKYRKEVLENGISNQ